MTAAPQLHQVDRPWPQAAKDAGIRDAAELVQRLRRTSKSLEPLVSRVAPALSVEEAVEVFRALDQLGEASWKSQVLVVGEIWFRFEEPSDTRAAIIGQLLGLSRSHVHNILAVWRTFGDSILEGEETRQAVYIAAARTSAPRAWVERAAGLTKRQLEAAIAAEERGVSGETLPALTAVSGETPPIEAPTEHAVSQETAPLAEGLQPRCPACGQALPA